MTKYTLDELTIPAPPYRMARPFATLAATENSENLDREKNSENTTEVAVGSANESIERQNEDEARRALDYAKQKRGLPGVPNTLLDLLEADAKELLSIEAAKAENKKKVAGTQSGTNDTTKDPVVSRDQGVAPEYPKTRLGALQRERDRLTGKIGGQYDTIAYNRRLAENEAAIKAEEKVIDKAEDEKANQRASERVSEPVVNNPVEVDIAVDAQAPLEAKPQTPEEKFPGLTRLVEEGKNESPSPAPEKVEGAGEAKESVPSRELSDAIAAMRKYDELQKKSDESGMQKMALQLNRTSRGLKSQDEEAERNYEKTERERERYLELYDRLGAADQKKFDELFTSESLDEVDRGESFTDRLDTVDQAVDTAHVLAKFEDVARASKEEAGMQLSPSGRLGADGRGVQLTDEQRAALQPQSEQAAPAFDEMRPREVPPTVQPEARPEAPVEQEEITEEEIPENPSDRIRAMRRAQERGGGVGGTIMSAVEWASRKTGAGAWLETFMPRAKSVYHRQFAERRAYHQEKAQGSLERAQEKFDDFKLKMADASWPGKKYYAWRMRAWEKTVSKREGLVNTYDGYRKKRVERHNELQKQVADRYDRELAPYKGKFEALKREEDLVKKVMSALEADQKKALAALAVAESKRKGIFGQRGAAAARTIKRESDEIARRLNVQREFLKKIQKPLAGASAKIEKYESKRKQVAANMKFLEMDNLKGVSRKRATLPERESISRYTAGESAESSREAASERDDEVWGVKEFTEKWNTNGSENLIRDPKEFEEFVESSRAGAGQTEPLRLGDLFKFAQEYAGINGKVKKFAQDKRYFLARVPKKESR